MKVSKNAWRDWPFMGIALGVVALSALGVAYWSSIQDRERYLQGRNFRLLADLASQTANLVENRARIFRDTLAGAGVPRNGAKTAWRVDAMRQLSAAGLQSDIARIEILEPADSVPLPSAAVVKTYRLAVRGDGQSIRISWVPPSGSAPSLSMRVPAEAALANVFRPRLSMGAFDTLVLATPDGHVVYAVGRRAGEMQAMSVTALLPVAAGKDRADIARFADTIVEERVRIAGVDYRLFSQPCCGSDAYAVRVGPAPAMGFLLIGLVEAEAIQMASWAISPVLILGGLAFVMAACVGWPFLKCGLMGPQQRVTRRDAISLGLSALFGLALATILLLTIAAYSQLSADVDGQLQRLANTIDARLTDEVTRAARQSGAMLDALRADPCVRSEEPRTGGTTRPGTDRLSDPCRAITGPWSQSVKVPSPVLGYPGYIGFALVDAQGFQRVKTAPAPANRRQVDVAEREYFQRARSLEGLWRDTVCGDGCFLESSWSWISGRPQVVLSRPTGLEALPVAMLAIPMRSVIDPVLPPGFEFAVVDRDGRVHFHSDTQRNVHENLLLETDRNRRLQSLLAAHGAGAFSTPYWGRPYRAYVRPTIGPDWSIVTLHDKQSTRALVLEWTAAALVMQAAYLVVWVAAMLLVRWRGASWLWPDPLRRPWYGVLALVCLGTVVVWAQLVARLDTLTMAAVGALLPFALWLVAHLVLATRPQGTGHVRAWSELCREYRVAGALMLVVSAALPAASFFALSHDLHMEAFVKQRQIALAHAVDRPPTCPASGSGQPVRPHGERYDDAVTGSAVLCGAWRTPAEEAGRLRDLLHAKIEELLPYYTSAAIALRELMHGRSDDGTWVSQRIEPGRLSVTVQARDPSQRVVVASPLPALTRVRSEAAGEPLVWTTLAALVLLPIVVVAAFGLVCFFLRHVVLADVVEPAREQDRLETVVGQHVLVICDDPEGFVKNLPHACVLRLMSVVQVRDEEAAWARAREQVRDAAPVQRTVIPDIDARPNDVGLLRRMLARIDDLTADPEQTVILATRHERDALIERARAASKWERDADRWTTLLERFAVKDLRTSGETTAKWEADSAFTVWWADLKNAVATLKAEVMSRWNGERQERDWRAQLLATEGRCHSHLARICEELSNTQAFRSGSLTWDQMLEEVEERAGPFYQRIWRACDEDARVVLEHVARHGLASAASRRVVRRLLARGLLRRDPDLRLMNQSFRRFVLEAERQLEVATLERQAEPSLWDQWRVPIATAAVISVVFLLATQREAFDATVAMAAGVTTAVPTLVRLTTLLAQWGGKAGGEQKMNT